MTTEEIETNLWSMANELRGTMDASEYKNYILAFIFYRYLSMKEEDYLVEQQLVAVENGKKFFEAFSKAVKDEGQDGWKDFEDDLINSLGYAIKPEYMWDSITYQIEENLIKPSTFQDMFTEFNDSAKKNLNAEDDFQGIFNDVNLGDPRLGGNTADRGLAVSKIIGLVDSTNYKGEHGEDILGEIYEYLIKQFAASAGKKGGEFYTPHEVSLLIAKIVTYGKKITDQSFTVFDPTCGSGSLLLTVGTCLEGSDKVGAIKYYGQELNTSTYNIARMNLIMHDVAYQDMHLNNADSLGADWPDGQDDKGIDHPRMFDAVVENPPYSQRWSADEGFLKDARYKDYGGKLAPKTKADYAFLLDGLYHLDRQNGVMGIVLPHGVLFRGGAEAEIRKSLIEKNYIDTIIGLPANLFYGASIPTIVMILKKDQKQDRNILFIDASQGFAKVKNKNVLRQEDIDKIFKTYVERKDVDKYAHLASLDEIKENDYNLNIPRYVDITEEEPEIDLDAVLNKINKDDGEIAAMQKEIDDQLKILGVLK